MMIQDMRGPLYSQYLLKGNKNEGHDCIIIFMCDEKVIVTYMWGRNCKITKCEGEEGEGG